MPSSPSYANNATSTLTAALSMDDRYILITPEDFQKFPSLELGGDEYRFPHFIATLFHRSLPDVVEIVRVDYTDAEDSGFSVVRAQEGTQPYPWPAGSKIECRITAGILDSFLSKEKIAESIPLGTAVNSGSFAVGQQSIARDQGVALGTEALTNNGGVAIGARATSSSSGTVSLGNDSAALGYQSISLGTSTFVDNGWSIRGVPVVGRGPHTEQYGYDFNYDGLTSVEGILTTDTLELGVPVALVLGQQYIDGDVVLAEESKQATAGDFYYRITASLDILKQDIRERDGDYVVWPGDDEATKFSFIAPEVSPNYYEGGTFYYWTRGFNISSVQKNQAVITLPSKVVCFPSELSFIAFKKGATTITPLLTVVGVGADGTTRITLLDAQPVDQIAAAYQRQRFALTQMDLGLIALELSWSSADASLMGRFCLRGVFFTMFE